MIASEKYASLEGVVAIVSGGARGIGEATVRALHGSGALVVFGDLLVEEGEALATTLGERAHFIRQDVTEQDDWDSIGRKAVSLGPLKVLVNNAGVLVQATVTETTREQFMQCINVNQLGVFLGMRSCFEGSGRRLYCECLFDRRPPLHE